MGKTRKELLYNLDTKELKLIEIKESEENSYLDKYQIGVDNVIITNDLLNLVYISDKEIFEKAKKMINITYSFEEVEEFYKKNYK